MKSIEKMTFGELLALRADIEHRIWRFEQAQKEDPKKMALIDADALLKDINDYPSAIDAVEVVRCENCRWFGEEDEDGQCWCNLNDISTLRHGFCNFGERRDEVKDD